MVRILLKWKLNCATQNSERSDQEASTGQNSRPAECKTYIQLTSTTNVHLRKDFKHSLCMFGTFLKFSKTSCHFYVFFSFSSLYKPFPTLRPGEICTRIKQTTCYKCDCHLPSTKAGSPGRDGGCSVCSCRLRAVCGFWGAAVDDRLLIRPSTVTPLPPPPPANYVEVAIRGLKASICANAGALGTPNRHFGRVLVNEWRNSP